VSKGKIPVVWMMRWLWEGVPQSGTHPLLHVYWGRPSYEGLAGMRPHEYGDVNKLAGIGFFLSLIGADVMGLMLYFGRKDYMSFKFALSYLSVVPLIQLTGLVSSLKSIHYVEEWGDRDYAEGGLFLNILFLSLFITSLIYFFGWVWLPNW
jgi:hypothetical protein